MRSLTEVLNEGLFGGSAHKAPTEIKSLDNLLAVLGKKFSELDIHTAKYGGNDYFYIHNLINCACIEIVQLDENEYRANVDGSINKPLCKDASLYELYDVLDKALLKYGVYDVKKAQNITPEMVKVEIDKQVPGLQWSTSKSGYLQIVNLYGVRYANIVPESISGKFTLRAEKNGRTQRVLDTLYFDYFITKAVAWIKKKGVY